jgi:hypothetical protein
MTNHVTAHTTDGRRVEFFASSDAERLAVMALLSSLRDGEVAFTSASDLADYVEATAPALQALADWIRAHQDALIQALIPTIVTVLVAVLMNEKSISTEDLDKLLENNSRPEVIVIHEDSDQSSQHPDMQHRDRKDLAPSEGKQGAGRDNEAQPPAHEQ